MKKLISLIMMITLIVSFFPLNQVEAAAPGTSELFWVYSVKKDDAPVRNTNSADGAVLTYKDKGEKVYGTPCRNSKGNAWVKILYDNGQTGYIYGKNVTDTGKKVMVNNYTEFERFWIQAVTDAPLRYGFTSDFKTVAKTDKNEVIRCIGRCVNQYGNAFLKVEYGGQELFLLEKNVQRHVCNFTEFSFEGNHFKYCFECSNYNVDTSKASSQDLALRAQATMAQIAALRMNGIKEQQVYKLTNFHGALVETYTVCKIIAYAVIAAASYPAMQELAETLGTAVVRLMASFDYEAIRLADTYAISAELDSIFPASGILEHEEYTYRKVKLLGENCNSTIMFIDSKEMKLWEAYLYYTMPGGGDVYCENQNGAGLLAHTVDMSTKAEKLICELHDDKSEGHFGHYHVSQYQVNGRRKYTTAGKHIFFGSSISGYAPYENLLQVKPKRSRWFY